MELTVKSVTFVYSIVSFPRTWFPPKLQKIKQRQPWPFACEDAFLCAAMGGAARGDFIPVSRGEGRGPGCDIIQAQRSGRASCVFEPLGARVRPASTVRAAAAAAEAGR